MVLTKRTWNLPLICQICGDTARGMNFEVMTCMSCKAFFRRHALHPMFFLHCQGDNNCEITRATRSNCSSCRLRKCFAFGMNSKLIRTKSDDQNLLGKKRTRRLPKPTPLNLLERDISTLTENEWNLLSNVIHAYDHNNPMEHTKQMLGQHSSIPPKLRSKISITLDIVAYYYSSVQAFLDRIGFFRELTVEARRTIIQHNSLTVGAYNSVFIVRETGALDNTDYVAGCHSIYGYENYCVLQRFISNLEQNGTFVKMMILISAFSGNCSIVSIDCRERISTMASTVSIARVQNILVTMFWKYLLYQYGFSGAVMRFHTLIKYILNMLRWIEQGSRVKHSTMVNSVVENTTRSLSLGD